MFAARELPNTARRGSIPPRQYTHRGAEVEMEIWLAANAETIHHKNC
jgi:hypothetical protein